MGRGVSLVVGHAWPPLIGIRLVEKDINLTRVVHEYTNISLTKSRTSTDPLISCGQRYQFGGRSRVVLILRYGIKSLVESGWR